MILSIVTICYNQKDIEDTCKSVANQTFKDFEWIVIDGGSTDGTVEKLQKYRSSMTHFISEKDDGIYNAMNKGILLAKGTYIQFLNGGDYLDNPKVLERVFKDKVYTQDILAGNITVIGEGQAVFIESQDSYKFTDFINNTIAHNSAFIKRDLFNKFGLYSEKFKIVSDWEKWIVFFKNKSCTYLHLDEKIAFFKNDGISNRNFELCKRERDIVLKNHYTAKELCKNIRALGVKTLYIWKLPLLRIKSSSHCTKIYLFSSILIYRKAIS